MQYAQASPSLAAQHQAGVLVFAAPENADGHPEVAAKVRLTGYVINNTRNSRRARKGSRRHIPTATHPTPSSYRSRSRSLSLSRSPRRLRTGRSRDDDDGG